MFAPFISLAVFITMLASTANTVNVPSHALPRASITRRTGTEQVTIACHTDGAPACICPKDLNGDTGVLINVYPGYQCAYRNGACTWSDQVRKGLFESLTQLLIIYLSARTERCRTPCRQTALRLLRVGPLDAAARLTIWATTES